MAVRELEMIATHEEVQAALRAALLCDEEIRRYQLGAIVSGNNRYRITWIERNEDAAKS